MESSPTAPLSRERLPALAAEHGVDTSQKLRDARAELGPLLATHEQLGAQNTTVCEAVTPPENVSRGKSRVKSSPLHKMRDAQRMQEFFKMNRSFVQTICKEQGLSTSVARDRLIEMWKIANENGEDGEEDALKAPCALFESGKLFSSPMKFKVQVERTAGITFCYKETAGQYVYLNATMDGSPMIRGKVSSACALAKKARSAPPDAAKGKEAIRAACKSGENAASARQALKKIIAKKPVVKKPVEKKPVEKKPVEKKAETVTAANIGGGLGNEAQETLSVTGVVIGVTHTDDKTSMQVRCLECNNVRTCKTTLELGKKLRLCVKCCTCSLPMHFTVGDFPRSA